MDNFADRLTKATIEKRSVACAGLDLKTHGVDEKLNYIPPHLAREALEMYPGDEQALDAVAYAIERFNVELINSLYEHVPVVKPNLAFYLNYGEAGIRALRRTIEHAHKQGLLVILDGKFNDIGSTAEQYADAVLGDVPTLSRTRIPVFNADAATINGYPGRDGIEPFLKYMKNGKGIYVLCMTSNPTTADVQGLPIGSDNTEDEDWVFGKVADMIRELGEEHKGENGYSPVGAVVGGSKHNPPKAVEILRERMPDTEFLIPGYGKQGGGAAGAILGFNDDGKGGIVNNSRALFGAWKSDKYSDRFTPEQFGDAARQSAIDMNTEIGEALERADKRPW